MKPVNKGAFTRCADPCFNSPESFEGQYRQYVTGMDMPIQEIDELIAIVHSILSYFVDQAFGVQTDQITLRSAGNGFNASPGHATIEHHSLNQTADVQSKGVEGNSNPVGPSEP